MVIFRRITATTMASIVLLAMPVRAQPKSPAVAVAVAVAVMPAPMLKTRLDELVNLLNGNGDYNKLFSPAFRQAVQQSQFETIIGTLHTQGGMAMNANSIAPSTPWQAIAKIDYQHLIATIQITVDSTDPHLITGLLITGAEPRDDSITKLKSDFSKLRGSAGFGIYRLDDETITSVAELNGNAVAPLGSAFKLWILAEAAQEVVSGQRHWSDVVQVGRHSLPSGILQNWPAHAPVTLQTLATLMISISDNTAADTLLTTLGQHKVGDVVRTIRISDPDRTLPVLSTLQAFQLKMPAHGALAGQWAKGTPEARERILATNGAAFSATPIDPHVFDGSPLRSETIEWFASPLDMARTLNWLRVHGDATTSAILAVNPGVGPATVARFAYLGFKGGSEPGVITLNFLVRTKGGQWLAITGNWHDPNAAVDELQFVSIMNRALMLAAS